VDRSALLVAAALALATPSPQATSTDPEVAEGIRQLGEGEYDRAILTLDGAVRRLQQDEKVERRVLARAYLHLGIAYVGKGHQSAAKASFRQAIAQDTTLTLDPEEYPPKVVNLFEAAKEEHRKAAAAASPVAAPAVSAPDKSGNKAVRIILASAGALGALAIVGAFLPEEPTPTPTPPASDAFSGQLTTERRSSRIVLPVPENGGRWTAQLAWTGANAQIGWDLTDAASGARVGEPQSSGPNSSRLEWEGRSNARYEAALSLRPGGSSPVAYELRILRPR
jgi:hypothetical protein